MSKPTSTIKGFVMSRLEHEPVERRAELYRALASVLAASDQERAALTKLADNCEAVVAAHTQLTLDFQRRARG